MDRNVRYLASALGIVALLPAAALAQPPLAGQALVDGLRRSGYVIFFRHAATIVSQADTAGENLGDCQRQRNLSEEGRQQARAIGQAFATLRIPVGQVLASQYCRSLETAQLAFSRVTPMLDLNAVLQAATEVERAHRVEVLKRLLATRPPAGTNTILVSHLFNIQAAADLSIAEGEAAVFEPGGTSFRLAARVLPSEWEVLASRFGR